MRILLTGATSKIGRLLIDRLLERPEVEKILCVGRSVKKLSKISQRFNGSQAERIEVYEHDLNSDFSLLDSRIGSALGVDLIIHMAAVTHATDSEEYLITNYEATVRLALWAQKRNCNKFCFISSQTAGLGAGEYALSKFLAEKTLTSMNWKQLLIIRPSEVMGLDGKEGLEKFDKLAAKFKIYPLLLDSKWHPIVFHPLGIEELLLQVMKGLFEPSEVNESTKEIWNLRGEPKTALEFATHAWKYKMALPVPVYVPLLGFAIGILAVIKPGWLVADQVPRLLGQRCQNPAPGSIRFRDGL